MAIAYCTVLSAAYVPRAVTLQRSISRQCPDAIFAYYCIDDDAACQLERLDLGKSWIVPPREFETGPFPHLKSTRRINEYCWTLKPVVLQHALSRDPRLDWVVWLDADMFAFGDLDSIFAKNTSSHVALTPHRFSSAEFARFEPVVGRFNAGFVAFRNSDEGCSALVWWGDRCLESCPSQPAEGRYADQKYLDEIADRFPGVASLTQAGVNAAPWNTIDQAVTQRDGRPLVAGESLFLYHFQGLKVIRSWLFDLYASSKFRLPKELRKLVYEPYLSALRSQFENIAQHSDAGHGGITGELAGGSGLYPILKHLTWSKNVTMHFETESI
jgi:hypothetical protein